MKNTHQALEHAFDRVFHNHEELEAFMKEGFYDLYREHINNAITQHHLLIEQNDNRFDDYIHIIVKPKTNYRDLIDEIDSSEFNNLLNNDDLIRSFIFELESMLIYDYDVYSTIDKAIDKTPTIPYMEKLITEKLSDYYTILSKLNSPTIIMDAIKEQSQELGINSINDIKINDVSVIDFKLTDSIENIATRFTPDTNGLKYVETKLISDMYEQGAIQVILNINTDDTLVKQFIKQIDDAIHSRYTLRSQLMFNMTDNNDFIHYVKNIARHDGYNPEYLREHSISDLGLIIDNINVTMSAETILDNIVTASTNEQDINHFIDDELAEFLFDNNAIEFNLTFSLEPSESYDEYDTLYYQDEEQLAEDIEVELRNINAIEKEFIYLLNTNQIDTNTLKQQAIQEGYPKSLIDDEGLIYIEPHIKHVTPIVSTQSMIEYLVPKFKTKQSLNRLLDEELISIALKEAWLDIDVEFALDLEEI